MEKTGKPHPRDHDLERLALLIREDWSDDDRRLFDLLSSFSVAARYDDPAWAQQFATAEQASLWIGQVDAFLSRFSL